MIEQEVKSAGILEKGAVDFLLWLEKHLAKEPMPKVDLMDRRRFLRDGLLGFSILSGALLGLGTSRLISTIEPQKQLPKVRQPNNITHFGTSWMNSEAVDLGIENAKNQGLTVLEAQPFRVRILEKAVFYQASNGAVLAIDEKAFTKWSGQTGAKDYMTAFVFNDATTAGFRVSGAQNIRISIDELWDQNVFGRNKSQLFSEFANSISSTMAAGADAIDRYGYEKISIASLDHTSKERQWGHQRYQYYMQLFSKKQMDPFIKVVALNPLWIRDKLR